MKIPSETTQNYTELHRMCVAEQTKWVQDMDDVGPTNVGTAYLVRQINDPSKFCRILNNKKNEQQIEEELDLLEKRASLR